MRKRTKQLIYLLELTCQLREATQEVDAAFDQGLDTAKRQRLYSMQDLRLAEQRLLDVRAGGRQAVDLDEVECRLGIGD